MSTKLLLLMSTKLQPLANLLVHISITYQNASVLLHPNKDNHNIPCCFLFCFCFLLLITVFLLLMFLHSHKQVFTSVSTQLLLSPSSFYACPSVNTIMRWTCRIQQLTAEKLTSHKRKRKKEVVLVLLQHQLARIPWLQTHTHTHSLASSTADQRPLTQ